ncbi:SRPBCC domain-containing protein [Streptomyces sp. ZYX-F-203]
MIDVPRQITSVRRRVAARTTSAGEARVVEVRRSFGVPPTDVWAACTRAERIPHWFLPISGELRPGGRYRLEGHAEGTIETCDPPKGFSATWEYDGDTSRIEVDLAGEDCGARLDLRHVARVDTDTWGRYGPGALGVGYDLLLVGLTLYLGGGGAPVDTEAASAWSVSEEGRRFVRESGERWCAADVAGGTEPAVARRAADRAIAFYL